MSPASKSTVSDRRARGARPVQPPTAARLEKSALHHLGRFAATRTELTLVLNRRVQRAIRAELIDRAEAARMVEAVVAKVAAAGYLDDAAVARARAGTMRRAGRSRRVIAQKLAVKGINRDQSADALAAADGDDANAELRAAATLAMRRKLGPYRNGKRDATTLKRDLAALARGGFPYAIARTVAECYTRPDRWSMVERSRVEHLQMVIWTDVARQFDSAFRNQTCVRTPLSASRTRPHGHCRAGSACRVRPAPGNAA